MPKLKKKFIFNPAKVEYSDFLLVKHNKAQLSRQRKDSTKMLLGFFGSLEGKVQGMKGFLIMDNLKDEQETLC